MVDQTLVDVELCHIIDNDSAVEVFRGVFGLEDVLEQGGFSRAEKSAEKSNWDQAIFGEGRILLNRFI